MLVGYVVRHYGRIDQVLLNPGTNFMSLLICSLRVEKQGPSTGTILFNGLNGNCWPDLLPLRHAFTIGATISYGSLSYSVYNVIFQSGDAVWIFSILVSKKKSVADELRNRVRSLAIATPTSLAAEERMALMPTSN